MVEEWEVEKVVTTVHHRGVVGCEVEEQKAWMKRQVGSLLQRRKEEQ